MILPNYLIFFGFGSCISVRRPPLFRDVFQLYCGLSAGATVRDLCSRYNPSFLRIDERYIPMLVSATSLASVVQWPGFDSSQRSL